MLELRLQRAEGRLLEQLLHGLAASLLDDHVVVLVGDERDVTQGGEDLFGVERLAAEQRVIEGDAGAITHEPEGDQWQWESLTTFEADTLTRALREHHSDFVSEALRVLHLW